MPATAPAPARRPIDLESAGLGRARRENFPIALRVLRAPEREALLAVYGFARLVDDIGDEASGDRLALLDWADRELDAVYGGGEPSHPAMRRLAPVVRTRSIPAEPFRRLIAAGRRDQQVRAYSTFQELLGYCELSANPVGELVLYVFGCATPERIALSDRVCSGLQIAEHLQDVVEDLDRGRFYLPAEDMAACGCGVEDLRTSPSPEGCRRVVALEADRARSLLLEGAPLARTLPWRAALAVIAFVAGGLAALDAIADRGFDVSTAAAPPPRVRLLRALPRSLRAARRSSA